MPYLFPNGRILIFAKMPQAGQVKTRLHSVLSPRQCAELQHALILHTLETSLKKPLCPVELWCTDSDHTNADHYRSKYKVEIKQQVGNDLGQRMQHAFCTASKKSAYTLLIGCDCPPLTPEHLRQSLQALTEDSATVVLIPSIDGGYVLIGLRSVHNQLFQGINWGSDQVLEQTHHKIKRLGLKYLELETLWDLDRPQDLQHLKSLPDWRYWDKFIPS